MISHATAPATVAHKNPVRPQPITNVAAATATRMTASVTISAPYWVHWSVPASIPSRVACRQNPASPTLSRPTDSQRCLDEHPPAPQRRATGDHDGRGDADHRGDPQRMGPRSARQTYVDVAASSGPPGWFPAAGRWRHR